MSLIPNELILNNSSYKSTFILNNSDILDISSSNINLSGLININNNYIYKPFVYYCSPSGVDISNGGSIFTPWKTIAYSLSIINNIVSSSNPITLTLMGGVFNENINIVKSDIYLQGNSLIPTENYINGTITFNIVSSSSINGSVLGIQCNNIIFNDSVSVQIYNYTVANCIVASLGSDNTPAIINQQTISPYYSIVIQNTILYSSNVSCCLSSNSGKINVIQCQFLQPNTDNNSNLILISGSGAISMNGSTATSSSTSTSAPSIIKFTNDLGVPYPSSFNLNTITYNSSAVDISNQKVCINCSNSTGISINPFLNNQLKCEGGRIIHSGSSYCVMSKSGAGSVSLTYSANNYAGATANKYAPAIVKTALTQVN